MKQKILLAILIFFFSFMVFAPLVQAACPSGYNCEAGCEAVGQCVGNVKCVEKPTPGANGQMSLTPQGGACGSSQLGEITPPGSIKKINDQMGGQIGLLTFVSTLLRLFAIICGIWTLFNFLISGYTLISAQYDTKAQTEVKDQLTMTVIGLVIIVSAYTMAGLFGLVFFGDATAIINPKLQGALE